MHLSKACGDELLVEWRSAAACARDRFRPDGYGCYRRGPAQFGFFLEYDRRTERAREYAAKLDAYYRHRDSGGVARDYSGFPTLLFVSTREQAEDEFAHQAYLAALQFGGSALPIRLTNRHQRSQYADGLLGPVWRVPAPDGNSSQARVYWLPAPKWRSGGDHPTLQVAASYFAAGGDVVE